MITLMHLSYGIMPVLWDTVVRVDSLLFYFVDVFFFFQIANKFVKRSTPAICYMTFHVMMMTMRLLLFYLFWMIFSFDAKLATAFGHWIIFEMHFKLVIFNILRVSHFTISLEWPDNSRDEIILYINKYCGNMISMAIGQPPSRHTI